MHQGRNESSARINRRLSVLPVLAVIVRYSSDIGRTGASQLGQLPKPSTTPRSYGGHDEQVVAIVRGLTLGYAPTIFLPSGSNAVARPSEGISPKHCTSPVHRAEGFWRNVIPVPMPGSKFRAFDNRPVSCRTAKRCLTPFQGDEICLAPIKPALRFKEMRYALRQSNLRFLGPPSNSNTLAGSIHFPQGDRRSHGRFPRGIGNAACCTSTLSLQRSVSTRRPSLRRAEFG
jgi:hypothetical protein